MRNGPFASHVEPENLCLNRDRRRLDEILSSGVQVTSQLELQVQDLIRSRYPHLSFQTTHSYQDILEKDKDLAKDLETTVAVYFPWAKRIVYLLSENLFSELRTDRNRNKITSDEQMILSQKRIGIIGLSVGHAAALTLALEGVGSTFHLADFDSIELSNLNRIQTPLWNIGLPKVIATARDMWERNPFLTIRIFPKGIDEDSLSEFCCKENARLDLIVEECDSLDAKYAVRYFARENRIPVIMERSDQGLLDVERFDLEPNRPILHGRAPELSLQDLKKLSQRERFDLFMTVAKGNSLSERMRLSMSQIGAQIKTWPQLASAVTLGGASLTEAARRILLQQNLSSGEYFLDYDKIFEARGL